MNNILVISLEWIDILYIKDLEIYRTSSNDKGFFKKINNKLIVDWDNWGEEIFVEYDQNIYYKDKYNKFNINIENESEYDTDETDFIPIKDYSFNPQHKYTIYVMTSKQTTTPQINQTTTTIFFYRNSVCFPFIKNHGCK